MELDAKLDGTLFDKPAPLHRRVQRGTTRPTRQAAQALVTTVMAARNGCPVG
jgi:hypothetical protein